MFVRTRLVDDTRVLRCLFDWWTNDFWLRVSHGQETRRTHQLLESIGPPCCCLVQPRFYSSRDSGQLICISLHAEIGRNCIRNIYVENYIETRQYKTRPPYIDLDIYFVNCGYIYCNWTYISPADETILHFMIKA